MGPSFPSDSAARLAEICWNKSSALKKKAPTLTDFYAKNNPLSKKFTCLVVVRQLYHNDKDTSYRLPDCRVYLFITAIVSP